MTTPRAGCVGSMTPNACILLIGEYARLKKKTNTPRAAATSGAIASERFSHNSRRTDQYRAFGLVFIVRLLFRPSPQQTSRQWWGSAPRPMLRVAHDRRD